MMFANRSASRVSVAMLLVATACAGRSSATTTASTAAAGTPTVGPLHGSVMVVGGGAQGPDVFAKFIELAGGPYTLYTRAGYIEGGNIQVDNT